MGTHLFMQSVIELATCDSPEILIKGAASALEHELRIPTFIELWNNSGERYAGGDYGSASSPHCTWIGNHYTVGVIRLLKPPPSGLQVALLACQLAPLAELLMDQAAWRRRTIREDIDCLYDRRIRDALVRTDWNASAVARELSVSRSRVALVMRRWAKR